MTMRTDRVGESIREVLAEALPHLKDPGLGFVSITGVDVSPDLRSAVVFFSVLDPESDRETTEAALGRARKRLQRSLADQLRMKRTPVLRFEIDPSIVEGERIDAILRDLHEDTDGDA